MLVKGTEVGKKVEVSYVRVKKLNETNQKELNENYKMIGALSFFTLT